MATQDGRATRRGFAAAWLAWLLLLPPGLAGCQGAPGGHSAPPAARQLASSPVAIAGLEARIDGAARGPAGLVANNSIGLVANNSIGLVANNSIGLAGPGTGGYRLASVYPEEPVSRALVYLTDAAGQFFVGPEGKAIAGLTDDAGRFRFGAAPTGIAIVVNVILSGQRRLVGFLVPRAGGNEIQVSMATTLVTEYLRDQARWRGKGLADFDLSRLPDLIARTQGLLDRGGMGPVDPARNMPDLGIANVPVLVNQYAAAAAGDPALAAAWAAVLGYRPLAVEIPLGRSNQDISLKSIAVRPDDSEVALALSRSNGTDIWVLAAAELDRIFSLPRGSVTPDRLGGRLVFRSTVEWTISRYSGRSLTGLQLPFLTDLTKLAWSPSGSLFVADFLQFRSSPGRTWLYRIDPSRPFPANYDRLVVELPAREAIVDGDPARPRQQQLSGIAFSPRGDLYVSDLSWEVIRRIEAADAIGPSWPDAATASQPCGPGCEVEVEADRIATASAPVVAGRLGKSGFIDPAGERLLDGPRSLVWDGQGIVVASTGRNAVLRLPVDTSGTVGTLQVLAGGGRPAWPGGPFGLASDDGAAYTDVGFRNPYAMASDGHGRVAVIDDLPGAGPDRVVLLADGHARTVLGYWRARFPDGGDARQASVPNVETLAWFRDSLLLGSLRAPVLARIVIPPEAQP